MATCAECVHVEVCSKKNLHVAVGMNITPRFKYKRIEQECDDFKDCSRFVELPYPVKPGDELWYILDGLGAIDLKDYQTTGGDCAVGDEPDIVFDVSTRGFWISGMGKRDAEAVSFEDCFLVPWDEIGKMYFLSREEAEGALKEREKDESKGAGVSVGGGEACDRGRAAE